jgi:phosphatidylserine synthase
LKRLTLATENPVLLIIIGTVATIAPAIVLFAFVRNNYFRILSILALLYPLGEYLQYALFGPSWIRWHLSDVGFVPSYGLLVTVILLWTNRSWERFPNLLLKGATVAFVIGVVYESSQFFYQGNSESIHPRASGDWVDIAIFALIYGLSYFLISKFRRSWTSRP